MTLSLALWAALIIGATITATIGRKSPTAPLVGTAVHSMTAPMINYTGNPNRIGAYVYVMENGAPDPQLDWAGTFIGMEHGMALVRDADTHVVAHVNRDQVYAAQRTQH